MHRLKSFSLFFSECDLIICENVLCERKWWIFLAENVKTQVREGNFISLFQRILSW